MRWERLFADLEAQAEAMAAAEFSGEVDERTRREVRAIALLDRLRAAGEARLRVSCLGGEVVSGTVSDAGRDWILLVERADQEALVALPAVTGVSGLGRWTAEPETRATRRLDLRYVARGLARDRAGVRVGLTDGVTLTGTIDRVGADFLELAEHPVGELRRADAVRGMRVVPMLAVAVVRVRY